MHDPTEAIRREMVAEINSNATDRERLAAEHGPVWNTDELQHDFEVEGFMAPMVVVKSRFLGVRGTLYFQHRPRFYFDFMPDRV